MALSVPLSSSQSYFPAASGGCSAFKLNSFKLLIARDLLPKAREIKRSITTTTTRRQLAPEKLEIFETLEGWAESNILTFMKPIETSWQPQDFLPDPSFEGFYENVKEIQQQAAEIPDEYLVCLVGNMITEEALPTYQTVLNTSEGVRDKTGVSTTPWARWSRSWTAEENRHGDLLNKYLYLTGRLDMRQVEKTVQYLISAGMNMHSDTSPYCASIYASFQERATFISHGNTARHAKRHGNTMLAKICGLIAADEKRHEMAYTTIVEKLFEVEPDTTMLALAHMMKRRITMPALFMFDGQDDNLFAHYSAVAQNVGVYTTKDYADMVEFFVKRWNVEEVKGLSAEGRKAQEYVCGLGDRFRKMEERAEEIRKKKGNQSQHLLPFSWIFNRSVIV